MNAHRPRSSGFLLAIAASFAVACGAASTNGVPPPPGQGQLAISLVDAPAQASQIVVNVVKVTAHSTTSGWITVSPSTISAASPLTVDLLTLQAPAAAKSLGLVNLPPGTITQVRLYVSQDGNYLVPIGSTAQVPLKIPSGSQSGIKIQGPWTITACSQTALTLDFDGKRSIWSHPADLGNEWILRPVIHTKKADSVAVGCGVACSTAVPCPEGQLCTADGVCGAGQSPGAPVGSSCTVADECLTRTCTAAVCAVGGANAPCLNGDDCFSRTCVEGSCTPPIAAGPAGSACTAATQCLSNACGLSSTCSPGGQGSNCWTDPDCQEGMSCLAGVGDVRVCGTLATQAL